MGRPPKLSRDAVIDAAERIVERDGINALTMRAVGVELGASTMAVYRYVNQKDELLVLLLDRAARQIKRPPLPHDPRKRLGVLCRLLYEELDPRPWAVRVLASGNLLGPSVLWLIEDIVASFVACGLAPSSAYRAYRVVWHFIVGELTVKHNLREAAADRPFERVLRGLDPAEFPTLAAVNRAEQRTADTFEPGLEALLNGLV